MVYNFPVFCSAETKTPLIWKDILVRVFCFNPSIMEYGRDKNDNLFNSSLYNDDDEHCEDFRRVVYTADIK